MPALVPAQTHHSIEKTTVSLDEARLAVRPIIRVW